MRLLAIDPGNINSAYCEIGPNYKPIIFGKAENEALLQMIESKMFCIDSCAIEMIASYGMAVGKEVFETCVWIGRFAERIERHYQFYPNLVYRKDVKMHICGNTRAKDANIRQALIDRFGPVGTKKEKGHFYGFKADIWSAYAVGLTYMEVSHER